jgi:ketosteroid isomerase-like protein
MSQDNLEIVRRGIDAFNRRDLDAIESDPDVEVDWSRSRGLEAGIYRGREAVHRFWATFHETFDRVVVVPQELIDHGDCVMVVDRTYMRGRDGIEVEAHNVCVATVRDGRVVRWRLCTDRAEALTAMGLAE